MPTTSDARGVLLIYTGGTLGSLPEDPKDPLSPLVPAPFERVMEMLPLYDTVERRLPLGETTIRLGTHSWKSHSTLPTSLPRTGRTWPRWCAAITRTTRDS